MVALITVKNSAGVVAQCDAKCYDAHDAECLCICGGKNHGAGFERALEQSDELVDELDAVALRAFAKQNGASVRGQAPGPLRVERSTSASLTRP